MFVPRKIFTKSNSQILNCFFTLNIFILDGDGDVRMGMGLLLVGKEHELGFLVVLSKEVVIEPVGK